MNTGFRYTLETPSKSYHCPRCNKKTYVRFVDTFTSQYLPEQYGRCSRLKKCQYHLNPYKDGYSEGNVSESYEQDFKPIKPKPIAYVPFNVFNQSRKCYDQNNFVKWLIDTIGAEATNVQIEKYHLGTSKKWNGANVFWQIDPQGNIRTGKIMLYNSKSGKRVKEPFSHFYWVHKTLEINHNQIFFGSHLLAEPESSSKPVAIVESEKTAVIASHYFNDFIWLASGGLSMLSEKRCEHLKGRKVVLWPDLNCFDTWKAKADELGFLCSDYLERSSTTEQKAKGLDLCDFLTIKPKTTEPKQLNSKDEKKPINCDQNQVAPNVQRVWSVDELANFFETYSGELPQLQLKSGERISDPRKFIESHLAIVRANNGKTTYQPYLERLAVLKNAIN